MSSHSFLQKGRELVLQATTLDNEEKYEEAYRLYLQALDYFTTAIKYEKNPKSIEIIKKKAAQYLTRAEQLKEYLDKKAKKGPVAQVYIILSLKDSNTHPPPLKKRKPSFTFLLH